MNRNALVVVACVALTAAFEARADHEVRLPREARLLEVKQASLQITRDAMTLLEKADAHTSWENAGQRQEALEAIVALEESSHRFYQDVGSYVRASELPRRRPDPSAVEGAMAQLTVDFQALYPALQRSPRFSGQLRTELERVRVTMERLESLFSPWSEARLAADVFQRQADESARAASTEYASLSRVCERPRQPDLARCNRMRTSVTNLGKLSRDARSVNTLLSQRNPQKDQAETLLAGYDREARITESLMRMALFSRQTMEQQAQARVAFDALSYELSVLH